MKLLLRHPFLSAFAFICVLKALPGCFGEVKTGSSRRDAYSDAGNAYLSHSYKPSAHELPATTQAGQTGTNNCGTESKADSMCQNLYVNSILDWCLYMPPTVANVSDVEADVIAGCTVQGRGARAIDPSAIRGATFVTAPSYVQLTIVGDFTKLNVPPGDWGGELDAHGADNNGNPHGDLVFHCSEDKGCAESHEWMQFLAYDVACIRVCFDGDKATQMCQHVYDTLGCGWNMPGSYEENVFQQCESDDAEDVSVHDGQVYQPGSQPVPDAHPAPALRNCRPVGHDEIFGIIVGGDPFGPTKGLTIQRVNGQTQTGQGGVTQASGPAPSPTTPELPDPAATVNQTALRNGTGPDAPGPTSNSSSTVDASAAPGTATNASATVTGAAISSNTSTDYPTVNGSAGACSVSMSRFIGVASVIEATLAMMLLCA